MVTIYTKLAELKKEVGKMTKDSKNPFFNSKYFDINQLLEHLEPLLQKNHLIVLQPIINKEGYLIDMLGNVKFGKAEAKQLWNYLFTHQNQIMALKQSRFNF